MPNMPDTNKVVVSAQVTRETHHRLKKKEATDERA